jgi:hypothetical protein
MRSYETAPLRWRIKLVPGTAVCGRTPEYFYGCYYPTTNLNTGESGSRGTGRPSDVEWLDGTEQQVASEVQVLRKELAEETATYRDEHGVVWTRPTAEAYMRVCLALERATRIK